MKLPQHLVAFVLILYISISGSIPTNALLVGLMTVFVAVAAMRLMTTKARFTVFRGGLFVVLTAALVYSVLFLNNGLDGDEYSASVMIRGLVVLVLLPPFVAALPQYESSFPAALKAVIWVHLGAWVLQFVFSNATGTYLDYLRLMGVRESKPDVYLELGVPFLRYRCTGLFQEPGTYASVVTLLLVAARAIQTQVNRRVVFVAIGTMILTGSGFGMVSSAVLYVAYRGELLAYLRKGTRLVIELAILIALVGVIFAYFATRLSSNDLVSSGIAFRALLVMNLISADSMQLLFGAPLDARDITVGVNQSYEAFPEDNGLWFFVIYHGGLVSASALATLIAVLAGRRDFLKFALPLLLKVPVFAYPLWFVFFGCLALARNHRLLARPGR